MSLQRGIDGAEPIRPDPVSGTAEAQEHRRRLNGGCLATGTLACPRCDAPVALAPGPASVTAPLGCPYCGNSGAVRDFLTLGAPTRPARVEVRVVRRDRSVLR